MPEPNPARLAVYLRRAAREAGYDTDTPRSGGLKNLAEASGLTQSTLSRTLNGINIPGLKNLQALATALNVPVLDLIVETGVLSHDTTDTASAATGPTTYTPEDAARLLEIPREDVSLFVAFVNRLRDTRS
ncbi:helix-turn-helix domain-containing protein [Streptomyces sp. TR02-1]|uniref:helix-turn-helix domain-containing protein n=1 Tax=Streptomyces sp. TR02-1 TaxID=3385977 RepID=UPI0039A166DB